MALLVFIVLAALSISATCSILEASLLSANVVRLAKRRDTGDRGAARLLELKEKHIDDSISAILTYNTIAHTMGAALAGAQAAEVFSSSWVGVFSAVLTVLILVFTEIIPKTVGTRYAERLAGFSGRLIGLMIKPPMKWLLYVTRALTRLVAPVGTEPGTTRGDVLAMVRIAVHDGALDRDQSRVLSNVLRFDEIKVTDVMTPRTVLSMLEESTPLHEALEHPEAHTYSRFPVFAENRDNVTGYVLLRDLLKARLDDPENRIAVSEFSRPILYVPETTSVGQVMDRFIEEHQQIAVVIDEFGVLAGLVTMEDLLETVLGSEIVDELDKVANLREVAMELRDRRLKRMGILLEAPPNEPEVTEE